MEIQNKTNESFLWNRQAEYYLRLSANEMAAHFP